MIDGLENLYPYLILVGATMGTVLALLWRQARAASRRNLALIKLNEQLNFDTPDFLRAAWSLLEEAGLRGYAWRLDWFGVPLSGQAGSLDGEALTREIAVGEMRLALTLYPPRARGERRYFADTLVETFVLLLRTDMLIKANATEATFSQMAKLSLFLQHDMKNVAQFIQLMADQLAAMPPGKERQVLDYLRTAAPLVRQRADHIVRTLTTRQDAGALARRIALRVELEQLCALHRLEHEIEGEAELLAPEHALMSALDNILKNYSEAGARTHLPPRMRIAIEDGPAEVALGIEAANAAPVTDAERLFEPFWTDNPSGLGIGLYHARQALEQCGGSLSASVEAGLLRFRIVFPRQLASLPSHM